jgi:O-antigen/teichoic acid export membrane protein
VPNVLETYGIYTFIISAVTMSAAVFTLGMNIGTVNFFNKYDDGTGSNRSFLTLGLLTILAGFLLFCLLVFIFKDPITSFYKAREPDKHQYLVMVIPLLLVTMVFAMVTSYISNFKRIVVPSILRNLIKVFLPIVLMLVWFEKIDEWFFLYAILAFNVCLVIGLFYYLYSLGELKFVWVKSLFTKTNRSEMRNYLVNGIFLSLGSVVASLIDTIMVGSMIDIGKTTAIYSIGAVISNILIMPNQAVASISGPIISTNWKANDLKSQQTLYSKASINLIIIGLLLFIGIWASIDDVFSIMNNGDAISATKGVILYLGLARLFSMACGINGMVLNLSPKYVYGTISILFLALLNIFTNYYFINKYGMVGAAMGTALSIFLYNLFIVIILYVNYRLQPFNIRIIVAVIFAVLACYLGLLIDVDNPIFNILIKSLVVGSLYIGLIYFSKLSLEINDVVDKNLNRIKSYLN